MQVLVLAKDFPSSEAPYSGIFVLRQVEAMMRRGIQVHVVRIVPEAPPFCARWRMYRRIPSRYTVDGIVVTTLRAIIPSRMLCLNLVRKQVRRALLRLIEETRADLVHVHTLLPGAAYVGSLPRPVVITAHGSDSYDFPWRRKDLTAAARGALARAQGVVCVSDFVRGHISRLGRHDADVVYNGADEATFFPRDMMRARRQLGLPPNRLIVAFAGGLLLEKGVLDLIAAGRLLSDLQPLFVFAGDGPLRAVLERTTDVPATVLGTLQHNAVAELFCASDVVVLPSYREGLPTVLCEAMRCGRPIVATCTGGIPEVVRNGETGSLVNAGDVPGLAAALRELLSDESMRIRYGEAAFAYADYRLSWTSNAAAYERIFRRVVATREPSLPFGPRRTAVSAAS